MELPDFDTLRHWALAEPQRLDALLHQQIETLIAQVGPEQQRRLRGLQFRIDCQRRLARNNMDSCIRIANMMHESVNAMRQHFNHLQDDSFSDPYEGSPPNNVILLATYRKDK
ncbi:MULTISPECIES: DUF3135 domain-containing protein [Aeromonas]|uniref:DUF3135 domain-containing protein n=1 Tax=Aeromonas TaxID=642 RepID=UPI001B32EEA2|nr:MULTISPECIES: DUF3135 domain-containing protein [Aeromonas]MBP4041455.1 DUF3135 domain-containing protein [Aeromonas sp. SrichE-2G]MCO4205139.1 DUF3135 domain-containing protein [Aeromonas taiwanensis]QXB53149.1 DUF3135 domain-containing protein [Aeromonas sp. FDAARGOS 1415]